MMVAPGGNRNAKSIPMGKDGREWSHGLCDCGDDCGTFCLSWFFPCITYSNIKHRYEHLNDKGYPDPEHGGSCCTSDCFFHGCITAFCGAGFIFQMSNRSNIRRRYNIKGGGCGDCCTALCCTPCELTQESLELELEERSFQQGHH
ncbi:PLAC8 family-domain-containing protein [Cyathus striatus]|nr:PLAC8 family-domain-containing protein [Cyathus striatus]KAF8993640.1 PLAC8 family-domain-containing protein [Cyathus striatus]